MAPKVDRIDHVHIHVVDRDAAERWYEQVLGFRRVPDRVFWAKDGGPLMVANEGELIHLALFERPLAECRSTVAMSASGEDFLAWRRHLTEVLGDSIEAVDHHISWSMYFNDPDGNPFEITSYDYEQIAAEFRKAPRD